MYYVCTTNFINEINFIIIIIIMDGYYYQQTNVDDAIVT